MPIVLGVVGRLAEVKDQGTLLRALALLFQDRPEWWGRVRLVLVGDGSLRDQLEDQVRQLALGEVVWMPGDRSDISSLLQTMDVFVLPSLAEGISNTVLEAMATGLPVVATAVGGNPELVTEGQTGHLVPAGDAQALCSALVRIVESPALRSNMGHAARQRVRDKFDWNRAVAEYLGVYDELLGRPGKVLGAG
jgi:glycosyltransferase involved in cell wall biosynthesis